MKKIILILILFSLLGCKSTLKKTYGITEPKLEDRTSIYKYLNKKKIDTSNVYIFKNLSAYAKASKLKLMSIPDAVFFNKEGYFVDYKKKASDCNAKVDAFLLDLTTFSKLPSVQTKKMDDLLHFIENSKSDKPINAADINVFITWAVFAGKLNDEKAFEWVYLLEKAKKEGFKINYYLINCDIQKSWKLSDEELQGLGIIN